MNGKEVARGSANAVRGRAAYLPDRADMRGERMGPVGRSDYAWRSLKLLRVFVVFGKRHLRVNQPRIEIVYEVLGPA